jgi:hypothetical protein
MPMSEEQRQKASERMKAMHAAKQPQTNTPKTEEQAERPAQPKMVQIDEAVLNQLMQRLAAVEDQTPPVIQNLQQPQTINLGMGGQTVGVLTKYSIDPNYYPDPTPMLFNEPTLQRFSPAMNYRFKWQVEGTTYETKFGTNIREPLFTVTMYRVDFDENGQPLESGFRLRRLQLTEDEVTMAKIATELGLDLNNTSLKDLLDVTRYHRIRQWVLEYFYPPNFNRENENTEMVDPVTGRVVTVENISKLL